MALSVVRQRLPRPFSEPVRLLEAFDEKALARHLKDTNGMSGRSFEFFNTLREAMTTYFQFGTYVDEGMTGRLPIEEGNARLTRPGDLFMQEEPGSLSSDKGPAFFFSPTYDPRIRSRVQEQYEPDMSFLDWAVSTTMQDVIEYRDHWDATIQWVMMKKEGQIRFQKAPVGARSSMTNDEYGAGLELEWTWMETNRFGINLATYAPLFKFQYFFDISTAMYGLMETAAVVATVATNNIVHDINSCIREIKAIPATLDPTHLGKRYFKNPRFRVLARDTMWEYLDAAYNLKTSGDERGSIRLQQMPPITFTDMLDVAHPYRIFIIVDKWQQNEYATRVPLEAHGPVDDINVFARKMAYRGAYGGHVDANSVRYIDFDPTNASFRITRPVDVNQI